MKRLEMYRDLLDNPHISPPKKFTEWFRIITLVQISKGYEKGSRAQTILNRIEKLYQKSI